jgi:hypothetical protein
MAKVGRKSAQRRNKKVKSVDPFAKGRSTKNLGTDFGFGYNEKKVEPGSDMPGNLKRMLKSDSKKPKPERKTISEKQKNKSAIRKLLVEGK